MQSPPRRQSRRHRTAGVVAALFLVTLAGCKGMGDWLFPPPPATCVLRPDATKEEIVQHLNSNITKLIAWRSSDVDISTSTAGGFPLSLSADIAVESPRNFRLVAKSLIGYEADFGSNPERFWFWMRRTKPKHVYTVRHDEYESIRGKFPIPFRPDWLMEALGVIPLDASQYEMLPRSPDSHIISLVSNQTTPDGRQVRRVVLVDSCVGRIVRQTLFDDAGRTIASAKFDDYQFDSISGVVLAHRIDLDWPQAQQAMTLRIGRVHVNPGQMPPILFTKPTYADFPELDLAKHFGGRRMRMPANRVSTASHSIPAGSVPTVDQVGRVRIASGTSPSPFDAKPIDRPIFADEVAEPPRPQFADEASPPMYAPPKPVFVPPIVQPGTTGEALPFPVR